MKKFALISFIAATVCSSLFGSCNKNEKEQTKCAEDVICTQMFAMLSVEVKDKAGNHIVLDSFYTLRVSNNEIIKPQTNSHTQTYYVILDDSYRKKLELTSDKFRFIAYKDGKEIINEPYEIGADCCHISKKAGATTIILP